MNVVDYGIIILIALCILFGCYRGFIQTLLNLGGSLLSFAGSFWLFPKLADALSSNTGNCPPHQQLYRFGQFAGRFGSQ